MFSTKIQILFKINNSNVINQCLKRFKSSSPPWQEIRIPVPWGHVAGKWWGPTDQRPVLTMHGWQDNSGSFDRLIPLLNKNTAFLAIDFPGHGYSSRIPSGLYCYFSNYLILVRYLVDYFKWSKVTLLGHSLGAITSFTYTLLYPKEVDMLMCIDALKPMVIKNNVPRMAREIDNFFRYVQYEMNPEEPPSYTMEEIKQKICLPNSKSIMYEHCHHLIDRNVAPSKLHPGKYYFTRDVRLKSQELVSIPQDDCVESAKHITCPVLVGKAISGSYYEAKANFYEVLDIIKKSSIDCVYKRMEGTHHYHLNNPEEFAKLVNEFLDKYGVVDKDVGGIKEEMLLSR